MKKIIIGIAALFSLLPMSGFAASSTGTSKSDVSIPCYNGGFGFGLAGYYLKPSTLSEADNPSQDYSGYSDSSGDLKSKSEISFQ